MIPKSKIAKAIKEIKESPIEIYWDRSDRITLDVLEMMSVDPENWETILIEHINETTLEQTAIDETNLINRLSEELEVDYYELYEAVNDYIITDYNIKQLLDNTPSILILIEWLSNYDCTVSFDTIKDGPNYLSEAWAVIRHSADFKEFAYEHSHVYGGSLLTFGASMSVEDALNLMRHLTIYKQITIPKGVQYGFFSSFQGSGSPFEATLKEDLTLQVTEEDYPRIVIDEFQSYSVDDVYGGWDFFDEHSFTGE